MKNLNIENAKKLFFTDKQHYLNFRKAWADAVNSPRNEDTKTQNPWITVNHVLLFCFLTEKKIEKAFTPITNKKKLENGMYPYMSLDLALSALKTQTNFAVDYFECLDNAEKGVEPKFGFFKRKGETTKDQWLQQAERYKGYVQYLLEPFNGTITLEMLTKLHGKLKEAKA